MHPRVCIGCGEAMPEKGNALSRNPNLCASCSSMADGMEESDAPESAFQGEDLLVAAEECEDFRKAV